LLSLVVAGPVAVAAGGTAAEPSQRGGVAIEQAATFVVSGAAREALPMAAWSERGGQRVGSAVGARETRRAPRKAVRYQAQIVAWPTASVKVLKFSAAAGGVLHPITDETLVYVLAGSAQATVAGKVVSLGAGDVASLPSGALTNAAAPADATIVAWTAPSLTPGATPAHVTAASVTPGGSGGLTIRRYEFPGNSVRAVSMIKGFKTSPNSAKTDSLIYVTRGPMQFFQDGQVFTVQAGDFIREVAGLMHNWDVTEESGFVTTSGLPIGAGPIDPNKATDRPK
jgi:quercetin dioxygenase-like cupin family protein